MKHFDADGNELDRSLPSLKELWTDSRYIMFGLFMSISPATLFSLAFDWPGVEHIRAACGIVNWVLSILGLMGLITIWWMTWNELTFFMYARRDHKTWKSR